MRSAHIRMARARMRAVAACAAAVAACAFASAPALALEVGVADQEPASFADPHLRGLGLKDARLIVPWDAATSEPDAVQAWLDATQAAGMAPHIAFEHLLHQKCPARTCTAPSRSQYRAAVRAFIARFPQVRTYTTWNEANHQSQPTADAPVAVAGYYDELRAACPSCTLVAADVIDSGSYTTWLRRFRSAAGGRPSLWGLHNYTDVTYGTTSGTDTALAQMPGDVWVEETGGIVVRRDGRGRELLRYDESRAAAAIDNAFAIAATRPRIRRMYVYQWRARVNDYFDAGLVRPDGSLRPSYSNVVAQLKKLKPKASTSARSSWKVRWAAKKARTLVLRMRCATRSCSGRATLVLNTLKRGVHKTQTARLGTKRYAGSAKTLQVRISKRLLRRTRAALRRSLALTVRDGGSAARKVVLTLRRPR
ncbi:MAG TPA: glycosyl hydrolase [Thermoleophilaceae bacterium]